MTDNATDRQAREIATRLEEVYERILSGGYYADYDYAAGEGLRTLREAVSALAKIERLDALLNDVLDVLPSTAEDPNESAYQRGRFDGVMEFSATIRTKIAGVRDGG